MKRVYSQIIKEHFDVNRQMVLLSGPRQVGKTTLSKTDEDCLYLNWDNKNDRIDILAGPNELAEKHGVNAFDAQKKLIVFDEIHKYGKWKQFLKGFFDSFGEDQRIIVTGSARLNIYKKSGDSLMGRYFNYRIHPFTVSEILDPVSGENEIKMPSMVSEDSFSDLLEFGGFPEPMIKADRRFYNKWRRLRNEQFFQEDLRDLTNINEVTLIETLAEILKHQSGNLVNYSSLSNDLGVSVDTVKRWFNVLENMYYIFTLRPFYNNVPKSLRKQPKVFLRDWSLIKDSGQKAENFIAAHLLKAVNFWTDTGFGDYELFYLRDKQKREVDFLVTKDGEPWFIVEAKTSSKSVSPSLEYFSKLLNVKHAFQVELNGKYVERDCFSVKRPVKVPAKTFLSQLI